MFYFKYLNFFVQNINQFFALDIVLKSIVLPLGISFFTFQQLSYVIDSYRGEVPHYNLLDYALFVTFFPQLIAGPIVSHSEMIPQFENEAKKRLNIENLCKGIMAFTYGMSKKVLIADSLGMLVDAGYKIVETLTTGGAVIVMLAYTMQIYFDFSGYCDMATGIGLMFNIELPINFNSPYKSLSIEEFWKRWHMTLTRFFTKYVYIPLGGNHCGKLRHYTNILLVFLVSGLWHGAGWSFVLWGMLHGIAQIFVKIENKVWASLHAAFQWMVTFAYINVAWVFFRAESISTAFTFFRQMLFSGELRCNTEIISAFDMPEVNFINRFFQKNIPKKICILILFLFAIWAVMNMKNTNEKICNSKLSTVCAIRISLLLVYCVISLSGINIFLYFGF